MLTNESPKELSQACWEWLGELGVLASLNVHSEMMTVLLLLLLHHHQLQVLVLSVLLGGGQAQQAPDGWESFPLTVKEVGLLKADLTRTDSIRTTNSDNQTCLISPLERAGPGCTWRSERRCERVPTARTVPVFSPWCSQTGPEGHLTRCRDNVERRPLVSRVKVSSLHSRARGQFRQLS